MRHSCCGPWETWATIRHNSHTLNLNWLGLCDPSHCIYTVIYVFVHDGTAWRPSTWRHNSSLSPLLRRSQPFIMGQGDNSQVWSVNIQCTHGYRKTLVIFYFLLLLYISNSNTKIHAYLSNMRLNTKMINRYGEDFSMFDKKQKRFKCLFILY